MGKGYLIDSNVIIDYLNKSLPIKGKHFLEGVKLNISIITQIEVLSSNHITVNELKGINAILVAAQKFDVNSEIALETVKVKLNTKIKLPDAVIAATAIYYNLTLVTRNLKDFEKVEGLKLIDPHHI